MKAKIKDFGTQILRTPLYPLKDYATIPKDPQAIDAFVRALFKNPVFKEAVFLASPELCYEWAKHCENHTAGDGERLDKSILKYYMRTTTNCVPFGLFSTYAVLDGRAQSTAQREFTYQRFSNLDMSFLHAALQLLNRDREVREKLTYRVNDTTYALGAHYRYVETSVAGDKRNYTLSALECDPVLDLIVSTCREGKTIGQLTKILVDAVADIDPQQAEDYFHELIDAHAPGKKGGALQMITTGFHSLDQKLTALNEKIGCDTQAYEALYSIANRLPIPFERKYLVNTNLKRKHFPIPAKHWKQTGEYSKRPSQCWSDSAAESPKRSTAQTNTSKPLQRPLPSVTKRGRYPCWKPWTRCRASVTSKIIRTTTRFPS